MQLTKRFFALFLVMGFVVALPVLCPAQTVFEPGDINSILEDNMLRDAITKYTSVYSYFFPEEASLLGFTSTRNTLNDRSPETDAQALQAMQSVQSSLEDISEERLSANKVADYHLLQNAVANTVWKLEQNRLTKDPLYYTQALDAVYSLLLFTPQDKRQGLKDLLGRLQALPKVAAQARQNLTDAPSYRARLAMEKSYYAYVAFDTLAKAVTEGGSLTNDPRDAEQNNTTVKEAKKAIKNMFDFFKALSQQEELDVDFRLEADEYTAHLKRYYHITEKPEKLAKQLDRRFASSQKELAALLKLFELSAETEEVTVVENLNEPPQTEIQTPQKTEEKPTKEKEKQPAYVPPTANQFYAVAKQLQSPFTADNLLADMTKQANTFTTQLVRAKLLPTPISLSLQALPKYFSYQELFVKLPSLRIFFLRLPEGNQLAQQETLNRDFTDPSTRLLISTQLVPGLFYQAYSTNNPLRRVLGSETLANGWSDYALQIAQEQNYFLTDEERLFVAWHRYKRALLAVLDQRLNTRRYTYDEANRFLTEEQGFTAEQAAALINTIIRSPGQAVSYVYGTQLWQEAAQPYQKKLKNPGKVNALLLQAGNVLPEDLKEELKRISQK